MKRWRKVNERMKTEILRTNSPSEDGQEREKKENEKKGRDGRREKRKRRGDG